MGPCSAENFDSEARFVSEQLRNDIIPVVAIVTISIQRCYPLLGPLFRTIALWAGSCGRQLSLSDSDIAIHTVDGGEKNISKIFSRKSASFFFAKV